MSPLQQPQPAAEPQAPFPGHPFGGLTREDGVSRIAPVENLRGSEDDDADDGAGFDFHLGVYSKF